MEGSNQITDLAQQLVDREQPRQGEERQQDSSPTAGNSQQWAEIGWETKKAFANHQADQAAGKGRITPRLVALPEGILCLQQRREEE
ncbi:hypothetical protein ColLi_06918 [Colletotrichum liriopes]|uniref:Uncharacterized protein n=1 Tax=Colletotrichum liriopes TaxID=708192 RepID=A0AA37GN95_9PEZI|nr:hypothetical protein ColLi_06918 [Colletotrichum liriopes]